MKSSRKALLSGAMFLLAAPWFSGCGGNTSGDGTSGQGTAFNDESAGRINLVLVKDRISVADTSGFRVVVTDERGDPVPNIEIACDTERGLALLEPTTGFELTDNGGQMSGRVGCVTPGSYQIGCRLPVGGGKRSLQSVVCEGSVPAGFTGFAGAGGGTLGIGQSPGSGGAIPPANLGSIVLSDVIINENGSDTLSVDVSRGSCGFKDQNGDGDATDPGDVVPEPFSDSLAKFQVQNESSEAVNFSSFSYEVSGSSGSGSAFGSSELSLSLGADVPAKGTASLTGLFLRANNGGKSFTGSSALISSSLGFRNVTFTLYGTSSSGRSIQVESSVGLSFGNFNKCSS